ncbi:hypothetical protein B0H17DRAFT_1028054 [Mycena rosella]|uniref:F-box domain-containing protein n=1 Tax=Mycena rosella TaxID=1033263 RepID=A0AAD7H0X6_MYCRO|nr:hypothetical protein B0H17DRAFT_1028054 [Mycena rosella]
MADPAPPSLSFGSPGLTNVENQVKGLIEATETNIERLTAQIRELTLMREKERSVLATLRLMIVPIGKLPTELLVDIFKRVVHAPEAHFGDPPFEMTLRGLSSHTGRVSLRRVLRLAQVSPYWRQITHTSPYLWTGSVHVDLDKKRTSDDTYLSGLQDLLARSSPLPISVSLTGTSIKSIKSVSASSSARARIIVNTAQRWRSLSLDMVPFTHFNDLVPGTFKALKWLNIRTRWHQTEPVIVFHSSPRLRSLTLDLNHNAPSNLALFQMPWSQLTDLHVTDHSVGGCRAILLQCSNLVSAKFDTSHDWDFPPEAAQSPVVVLPSLKTLVIEFSGATSEPIGGVAAFFMPLALPSLKTLDLQFNPDGDLTWPTEVFSQFQNRSQNIKRIDLMFSVIDVAGLVALLRHSPALTTLDIQNCWNCVEDAVFEALRYDDGATLPLAPKLQNLHFTNVGLGFEEDILEAAIRSRWWTDEQGLNDPPPRVARLKSFSIACADDGRQLSEDLMNDLIEQGLELHCY